MKKRVSLRIILLSTYIIPSIFLSATRQLSAVDYPDPSTDPYIPFTLQAPWYTGLGWTAGGTGSFYGDNLHISADRWALDFNAPDRSDKDSLVLAAADGSVVKADCGNGSLGCVVTLGHIAFDGFCYQSIYAHLLTDSFLVSTGDWIPQGYPLGRVGSTGLNPNSEHLHFAIHRRPINECRTNTAAYRPDMAVVPEPLVSIANIQDGQVITSTTFPVGLPVLSADQITSRSSPLLEAAQPIIDVYRRRGGQYLSFGRALGPLETFNGIQYQEFEPFQPPGFQTTPGFRSVIVAQQDRAAFMYEEMWDAYRQNIDAFGFPQADTYQWRQGATVWYRLDFDNEISLLWNGQEGNQSITETIDTQNGSWYGRFWPAPNQFEGNAYIRRDKVLDFYWPTVRDSGPFANTEGFSAHWEANIGGIVSLYTLSVRVQGNAEIFVDGNLVEEITSPEEIATIEALQFGIGAEKVEIFYWQSAGNPGRLSVTTDNPLIRTVFASDGIQEAETLPAPDFTYASFPPGLRDEQTASYGSGSCPVENTDGIDLHQEESTTGLIYVSCVDLTDPNIRIGTVMAQDVLSILPSPDARETVTSIVERDPHLAHHPILAFNADYFRAGSGPEGFTVVNGLRIDGPDNGDLDGFEFTRSSLSLSRVNTPMLGIIGPPSEVESPLFHLSKYYNSVGGGPLLLTNDQIVYPACETESFPEEVCGVGKHTAVGITNDGKTLVVAVAENKSALEMAQILHGYGAVQGIKMSGGSASHLWYRGESLLEGEPVANAIVIYQEEIPRHHTTVLEQSQFPIVQAGERFTMTMRLANTGFLPWETQLNYALQHVGGELFSIPSPRFLPATVNTGYDLMISLEGIAPNTPGAYQSIWQLIYQDSYGFIEPVSEEIGFLVTVLPEGTSLDFIESLRQFIDQFIEEVQGNARDYLDELKEEIEARIRDELLRLIPPELLCLFGLTIVISPGWAFSYVWRKKERDV